MPTKAKGGTIQIKALDENNLMPEIFALLVKRVHFLANKSKGGTIQVKALDKYNLMALLMLLLKRIPSLANKT